MANLQDEINSALRQAGANAFRARAVSKFVSQCYELLAHAHYSLVEPERWRAFCGKRGATTKEKDVLDGGERNIAETAISADLSLEANRLLAAPGRNTGPVIRKSDIAVTQADVTAPSDTATGRRSKRPDIVFFPAALETQLTFALEAKVIRKSNHVTNDLLGDSGFGCFVRVNDPYESNGVVGLLGYVEKESVLPFTDQALADIQEHGSFSCAKASDFQLTYSDLKHDSRLVLSQVAGTTPMVCITGMLGMDLVTVLPTLPD